MVQTSSSFNEQPTQKRPFITDDHNTFLVGGMELFSPAPEQLTEGFCRELDYLDRETNEVQQATESSELQDLCLAKSRAMQQALLWADYCEAKREQRALLYPAGDPEEASEQQSNKSLNSSAASRVRSINSHRFADFLSRTAIAAILREKKWQLSSGNGSDALPQGVNGNVSEYYQSFFSPPSPSTRSNDPKQVVNVDLEKQSKQYLRQVRAELLFDMNSQLLLRKDLPYAEPHVLSCLHRTIDDVCRRRKNDECAASLFLVLIF